MLRWVLEETDTELDEAFAAECSDVAPPYESELKALRAALRAELEAFKGELQAITTEALEQHRGQLEAVAAEHGAAIRTTVSDATRLLRQQATQVLCDAARQAAKAVRRGMTARPIVGGTSE